MTIVKPNIEIELSRDKSDAKFLACAVCVGANFLITGDQDFSEAEKLVETTIISVAQFKKIFC